MPVLRLIQHLGVGARPSTPANDVITSAGVSSSKLDLARVHRFAIRLAVDRSALREQVDAAGDVHARLAALGFDLAPRVVRESREMHVVRRVVAVANDAAVVVRGAAMMATEIEPFEPDHRLAGACGEPGGGTADAAETDDGDVEVLHGIAP